MSSADSVNDLIKELHIKASADLDKRVHDDISRALAESEKHALSEVEGTKSADKQSNIWRTIMKSPITKFAAAAVIVIAALLVMTLFEKGATQAYALEQTIEANHTIRTIHMRMSHIEENAFMDCWVQCDDAGKVSHFRHNLHGDVRDDDDNLRFTVWNEGVLKTWMPLKNVVIVSRLSDVEKQWERFASEYDPKLILQRLYDLQEDEAIELKIDEPAEGGDSIYVEAINSVDKKRLELVVDRQTKLVTQLSEYSLDGRKDDLAMRIRYFSYNEPIDPSVFVLSGIPDDALVYDQIDQLVGLEKGDLTDNEIAVEVVRASLEATIAKDYEEVSRLMEGDPGDTIEEFIEDEFGARLVRIISMGQPGPHETWPNILCVPCEIEIEDESRTKQVVNITATAKAIGYQPGDRWIAHTDLKANLQEIIIKGAIVPGESVGDYQLNMSKDDVLKRLGKPHSISYESEEYSLQNLPREYYMSFRGGISFLIVDGLVDEIGVQKPFFRFTNGLGVGDSEDSIIQAFGDDFRLNKDLSDLKDYLIYRDKGLMFEIHKENRTVMEINVSRTD